MKYGLTVTADKAKIFKQVKTSKNGTNFALYSTMVSNRDMQGNWKNAYISLKFRNGVDVPNKSVIKFSGFMTFNANSDGGERYPYVFVDDFEILEEGEDSLATTFENMANMADDLPFM